MGAEKRNREEFQESMSKDVATAAALLGLGEQGETAPLKKLKLVDDVTFSIKSMALTQRQLIFNFALIESSQVLGSMVSVAVKAGCGQEAVKPEIVLNQITALQSLFSIVVAELSQLCNVTYAKKRLMGLKKAKLLSDEIKRLGSTRLVVQLLKLLVTQIDSRISNAGLSRFTGSVTDSLSDTFNEIKAEINQIRKSKTSDKNEKIVETTRETMEGMFSKTSGLVVPQGLLSYVSPLPTMKHSHLLTPDLKSLITNTKKLPTAAEIISQASRVPVSA